MSKKKTTFSPTLFSSAKILILVRALTALRHTASIHLRTRENFSDHANDRSDFNRQRAGTGRRGRRGQGPPRLRAQLFAAPRQSLRSDAGCAAEAGYLEKETR